MNIRRGQSTIEFTFSLIIMMLLVYGMIALVRWCGMDLAERRWAAEQALTAPVSVEEQLKPETYRPKRFNPQFKKGY